MNHYDYDSMISDCAEAESRLSQWESEFIASIADRLGEGRDLTIAQEDKLTEIWNQITSY